MTKHKSRATRLSEYLNVVQAQADEIKNLQSEIEDWMGNMEGTNLEYTYKYEQLTECNDALEDMVGELEDIVERQYDIMFPGMF